MYDLAGEADRLAAVRRYHILDTPPGVVFDRITATAARVFTVPIALLTVVDRDRIWVKSCYGLSLDHLDREPGLCASAIGQRGLYVIPDAQIDPRTQGHSLVRGELGVRFYAAAPLTTADGHRLGTLCIIDRQPRQFAPDQLQTLVDLAAMVMDQIDLRHRNRHLAAAADQQRTMDDLYHRAPWGYHSLDGDGLFLDINDTELAWLGYDRASVVGKLRLFDLLTAASQATFADHFSQFKRQGQVRDLELELVRADGSTLWVVVNAMAEYDDQGHYLRSRSTVHNIGDRKRTETALQQINQSLAAQVADRTAELAASNHALHLSNQHFRNAFDYAGIGMALVSLEGRFLKVNRSLCEITGYDEDDLIATDFQAITHPDDLEIDLDQLEQLLSGVIGHYHLEKRYRHRQGHWIWGRLSVSLVRDAQQQPLYFVAQIQDIDDQKQTEIALRQSQARLLEAQAVAHMGSWEYDVATRTVTWSAEKFRILGRDPALGEASLDELLRRYHPDDGDQLRQAVGQALAGKPYHLRLRCTREDGSIRHLEEQGQVERNAEGEVVRVYGIVQDITDRVLAEQERQEISTALALAVEGISRLDNAGRYTQVNQAYAAMTGYAPDDLLGQPWQITVHPDDLDRLTAAYETMLTQGKVTVDARGVKQDGSTFHQQLLMVVAHDDRGQRQGHYCFMKDISDQVQLEADRRQAEIALQESEERYRLMVSALSEGLAVVQADGTLLTCNASAARLIGLPKARLLGRSLADLEGKVIGDDGAVCPVDDLPPLVTLRTGQPQANRMLGIVKSRHITWVSINTQPLLHPGETQPYAVVVSFADITDLRRSEVAALRRQADQERLLSDIAQRIRQTLNLDAILNTTVVEVQQFLRTDRVMVCRIDDDNQGTIVAEATTVAPSLLGQQVPIAISPDLLHGVLTAVADLSAEAQSQCPINRLTQAQGKVVVPIMQHSRLWGLLLACHNGPRPWLDSELEVLQRLVTQIAIAIQQSQLYQRLQGMNRQLEHLATHDGLTQVANRRSFDTYLQQEWARLGRDQAPLSLILCDIDYFKLYNDTYGHPAGDACLQQVAQVLEQAIKRPADLVARYGGEEFAIVLPNTDTAGAISIAADIQQTLADQAIFHGASPLGRYLTLSLGLATTLPTLDRSAQTLIDAADAALYRAKNQGRDRYCLAPGEESEPQL